MRILISGGGDIGRTLAEALTHAGEEVVLIEKDHGVCTNLATELDMMVICGDATRPEILEKAEIEKADLVLAVSGNDQGNLITALMAREYGSKRVIVRLDDPAFNIVCRKLGVEEIVNPKIATARQIADMARMPHAMDLSTLIGGDIRAFTAIITEGHDGARIEDLDLPRGTLSVVLERGGEFLLPEKDMKLKTDDHLTMICTGKSIEELEKVFA